MSTKDLNITDVDDWVEHFKGVIKGDIVPDERTGVFLVKKKISRRESDKDKNLSLTIVSPIAGNIDSAKSELEEQKEKPQPTDNDPISHFPPEIKADLSHRRTYKKQTEPRSKKPKKRKLSAWDKY